MGSIRARGRHLYFFPVFWPDPWHWSYHASGERHLKLHRKIPKLVMGVPTREARQRPDRLVGAEALACFTILKDSVGALPAREPLRPPDVLLDADGANFRDDAMFLRVFLLGPGGEIQVPNAVEVGPIALEVFRHTRPWIGCALFQQEPGS